MSAHAQARGPQACTAPNRQSGPCTAHSRVESSGPTVLVDHAAEDVPAAYGCVDVDDDARVVVGWLLVEALVWTVPVEVGFVLAQHGSGVVFVVDKDLVGALGSQAAAEAPGERVGRRTQLHRMR